MQRVSRGSLSKPAVLAGAVLPAAWLLTGCGSGADLVSNVALPSQQAAQQTPGFSDGVDVAGAPDTLSKTAPLALTPAQRGYLDALAAEGVRPANELRALSIGSYVCQARAAGQSEQAVRDYVAPMVRSDVADSKVSTTAPGGVPADIAISAYIRVASQRLC